MSVLTPGLQSTLRKMVDPDFGLANRFIELGVSPYAPEVFVTCADGGPPSYLIDNKSTVWDNCSTASGAAYRREDACWATLGELAERYCASIYDRGQLIKCAANALPGSVISFEDMILYSAEQYARSGFPYYRYDPGADIDWAAGYDVASARAVFAPAQLLYLSHEWAGEALMQTVSTGLACHSDPEQARRSAMLELIERDGFASSWVLGMPLPRLELTDADRARLSPRCLQALDDPILALSLHGVPNEFGVPNVFVFSEHHELKFGTVGGAAKLCPYEAIEKAVVENLHGWASVSQNAGKKVIPNKTDINTPHDHAVHFADKERWPEVSWFRTGSNTVRVKDLIGGREKTSVQCVVDALKQRGYEPCAFDLTTSDIRQLGFCSLRAFVPGLQTLHFGQTPPSEDRRRLAKNASFWNWKMPAELVSDFHPFP